MINIIIRQLREQRNSIIYYIVGLGLYLWFVSAMFPTIKQINFEEILSQYPESMQGFLGDQAGSVFTTLEGFLSVEFISAIFLIAMAFYIGSSAGSIIAGRIEKKIMDFDLSQPLSRIKQVLSYSVVSFAYSALIVTVITILMFLFSIAYADRFNTINTLVFLYYTILFVFAFFGISIFFSSIFRSKLAVIGINLLIVFGSYIYTSLAGSVDKLKDYKFFSIFYLYDSQQLLLDGVVKWQYALVLLGIFLVGTISALLIFNKKDI